MCIFSNLLNIDKICVNETLYDFEFINDTFEWEEPEFDIQEIWNRKTEKYLKNPKVFFNHFKNEILERINERRQK